MRFPVATRRNGTIVLTVGVCLLWLGTAANVNADFTNVRINSDTTTELQNEQQIHVSPVADSVLLGVWRDFRLGHREVGIGVSTDFGATWSDSLFATLPFELSSDPVLTYDAEGNFYALMMNYGYTGGGLFMVKSGDDGSSWDEFSIVSLTDSEDKEWLTIDRTGGPYHGNIYVTWTDFSGWDRPIKRAMSVDGGMTFTGGKTINTPGRVQWSVPVVGDNGLLFVAWVSDDPTSIRYTRSVDGGDTFEPETILFLTDFYYDFITPWGVKVYPYPAMDADITGGVYHGNLYLAFADRRNSLDLDIFFSRSLDNGLNWSEPLRINDDYLWDGINQFHPWINVNPDGVISVAFLDTRVPPDMGGHYDLFVTCSFDGGLSFSPNQLVSTVSSYLGNAKIPREDRFEPTDRFVDTRAGLLGEYIGLTATTSTIHPLWTDTRNGHQDAYTAAVPIGYHSPELLLPEDGVVLNDAPTNFHWTPTVCDTLVRFRLEVSTDSTFGEIDVLTVSELTSNFLYYEILAPIPNGYCYWRIVDSLPDGSTHGQETFSTFVICRDIQPSFTAAPTIASVLEPIQFTNNSNALDSCQWNFGDGKTSKDTNPVHAYDIAGYYTVTLTCYLDCEVASYTDSVTYPDYIFVNCCVARGDVDHSDGGTPIDIADLVYLVDYMFNGGPEPPCLQEADIDAGGGVDISDLVYLVDFMFSGGPAPPPCL